MRSKSSSSTTTDPADDIVETLPPVHAGEVLLEEWMKPLGLTAYTLAKALGIERTRLERIVRGQQPVSANTALRLSRYLGTTAEMWLGLQAQYDIDVARREVGAEIERQVQPRSEAA